MKENGSIRPERAKIPRSIPGERFWVVILVVPGALYAAVPVALPLTAVQKIGLSCFFGAWSRRR